MLNDLLFQLGALAGFGAAASLLINILKTVKIVKDDQAVYWSGGINLLGLIVLYIVGIVQPGYDVTGVDAQLLSFITAVTPIVEYVLMMLSGKLTHYGVRGLPAIGKSFSSG